MKNTFFWLVVIGLAAGLALVYLGGGSTRSHAQEQRVEVFKGVSVPLLPNWSPSERKFRNAVEIVFRAERTESALLEARILISTEPRRSHEEALNRLVEIAAEYDTRPTFLEIGGWPAMQRTFEAPVEQRGQRGSLRVPERSVRVTTAIAAADLIVRMDGVLMPTADPKLAEQMIAIGRSTVFAAPGRSENTGKELKMLREKAAKPPEAETSPMQRDESQEAQTGGGQAGAPEDAATTGAPTQVFAGRGELEVSASNSGRDVVIAANSGWSFSNNFGATWTFGAATAPAAFPRDGDPSLAHGQSGNFYYAFIGFPNGTAAANNVTGCSTGVSVSTDNGQTFNFRSHATLCPNAGAGICFPDQEHIAADRTNAANNQDQVYSVWRNFVPAGAPPAACSQINTGFPTASIVCSQDNGTNWTAPAFAGAGDFPRVTVGSDGFVYVFLRSGNNFTVNKFSSCSAGLAQQVGFPVTIANGANVTCPVAGLDRCNSGNTLSSLTGAVDDTDPNHVFAAFATNTAAGNENIIVSDSTDGGATWPRQVVVNSNVNARRFMPWMCAANGRAHVTWYDRRAATNANNDLTDFFLGRAFVSAGNLIAGTESNLSNNPDAQCASGWPCAPRSVNDSESCSIQPQNAGRCRNAAGGGSNLPCDFSAGGCPAGEACSTGGGCPKYGDYNGIGCAPCRVFTAWASATSPQGLPGGAGIRVFSSVLGTGARVCAIDLNICRRRPWLCPPPVRLDKFELVLRCDLRPCIVLDPIPRNCLYKFNCPGCPPNGLCPPYYHMFLDGLEDIWKVKLIDAEGNPAPFEQFKTHTGIVLSFRPSKENYIEGQIGNYALAFEIGPRGKLGAEYKIKTRLETGNKHYAGKPEPK